MVKLKVFNVFKQIQMIIKMCHVPLKPKKPLPVNGGGGVIYLFIYFFIMNDRPCRRLDARKISEQRRKGLKWSFEHWN